MISVLGAVERGDIPSQVHILKPSSGLRKVMDNFDTKVLIIPDDAVAPEYVEKERKKPDKKTVQHAPFMVLVDNKPDDGGDWLSLCEYARKIKRHRAVVSKWVQKGHIPCLKEPMRVWIRKGQEPPKFKRGRGGLHIINREETWKGWEC